MTKQSHFIKTCPPSLVLLPHPNHVRPEVLPCRSLLTYRSRPREFHSERDHFATDDGRVHLVPADIIPANERPDTDYPMVLITGRQLEHWHTGSMTRRATVLDAIEPDPVALVHPLDLADMGGQPGDLVTIESRRGKVALYARADESSPRGAVFVPFCYYEAAINKLTNAALDPFAKIPEFKYCAIRVCLGGVPPVQSSFGGGQALANSVAGV